MKREEGFCAIPVGDGEYSATFAFHLPAVEYRNRELLQRLAEDVDQLLVCTLWRDASDEDVHSDLGSTAEDLSTVL